MITHDEAYTKLVYGDKVVWHEKQFLEDYIRQNEQRDRDVARYLKLQEKKNELLGLYRQQREDRKTNSLSSATLYWDLQRQIDELEKELKKELEK
jgi:lipopolysaccharide biosynthesis protein